MKVFERLDQSISRSEDEKLVIDAVRRMVREKVMPRAAAYDETSQFPWDNIKDINDLEMNRIFIPEEYEGTGLSYSTYLACCRELSMACAATGIIWATNFHAAGPIMDFGSHEQKKRWLSIIANGGLAALALTEPGAGSDATGMRTRLRPHGNEIVIDGSKTFITNGDVCDVLVLFGKWSELGNGRDAISIAVVEKGTRL